MLTAASSPEECAAWLHANLPEAYAAHASAAARANALTGAALFALREDSMGGLLGIHTFGARRKLTLLLKQTADKAPAPPTVTESAQCPAQPAEEAAPEADTIAPLPADECDQQMGDECMSLGDAQWVVSRLNTLLDSEQTCAWAGSEVRAARLSELTKLRAACELPSVSIVVVGNTGAGKSTLLNALLQETNILPTNGMRACTASLVELRHESTTADAPLYRGEVEFLSVAEWEKELADMIDDLTTHDGSNAGRVSVAEVQPEHPSYASWCRLYAVYGDVFKQRERTSETTADGKALYRNPTVAALTEKLKRTRHITRELGTTKSVTAHEASTFRKLLEAFMDSKSDLVTCNGKCPIGPFGKVQCRCGTYWPIVKQVRLYSRRWDILKTGAVLVDAPGVHDDNSARDGVVRTKLKEADAIWIVSNIVRAVNDKTAKDLLGEQFRRQMLMDGQYNSLTFIATQSDVIERSEAIRSLRLPPSSTLRECAEKRNRYTRRRLREDFRAGLQELARDAGDASFQESAFELPVFTVSSVEFQKLSGLRPRDGAARVWDSVEQTMIPQLVRYVQRAALSRRKVITLRRCEAVRDFTRDVNKLLQQEGKVPAATRAAAKEVYELQAKALREVLTVATDAAGGKVAESFDSTVAPQLKAGADAASEQALKIMQQWGVSVTQGGLHWATYKASCRRDGVWRVNMNEALVEPIFKAVSTHWEKAFVSGLHKILAELEEQVKTELNAFQPKLLAALDGVDYPRAVASGLQGAQFDGVFAILRTAVANLKHAASKQQRDLSRSLEPLVQQHMIPGYQKANAESGTGSHRRRVELLESHARREAKQMFKDAAGEVVKQMTSMREGMGARLRLEVVDASLQLLRTTYTPLWDEMGENCLAARRLLQPKVAELLLGAERAVRRLGSDRGAPSNSVADGAEDPGDELIDTTEIHQQAKRQRQLEETIDLSAVEGAPLQPVTASASQVRIKPEVTSPKMVKEE